MATPIAFIANSVLLWVVKWTPTHPWAHARVETTETHLLEWRPSRFRGFEAGSRQAWKPSTRETLLVARPHHKLNRVSVWIL